MLPDGIDIKMRSGISKIYFSELPQEVQERFHYGSLWSAQQPARANEETGITQQQKIEGDQQSEDEPPGNLEIHEQKQRDVLAKVESIRIPYLELRDVTVREAVEFLGRQGKYNDPPGTGVLIGLSLNDAEPADQPIPRVTLLLQDVTLLQAVTAIAQQIGLSVNVVDIGLQMFRLHRELPCEGENNQ